MKVREKYKDRKDVEFITVSIDASGSFEKWKEHMKKHNLTDAINLIAFADKNSFQDDYGIMGIPMCFRSCTQWFCRKKTAPLPNACGILPENQ
jgi:hypothetical protein